MSDHKTTRGGSPAATPPSALTLSLATDPAPPGPAFRRAATADEASPFRRRPPPLAGDPHPPPSFSDPPAAAAAARRRSSTFSDYSIGEARRSLRDSTDDLLNPRGSAGVEPRASDLAGSLPLALALLPAAVGILFRNGSAVTTDAILLCLAAVFLRYTVTQPWQWYHSAQEVRIREELASEYAFDDDSEGEASPHPPPPPPPPPHPPAAPAAPLEDVPEEGSAGRAEDPRRPGGSRPKMREAALRELYAHEVLALVSCFASPMVGAYLLHAIRAQLSRPSEGLVSNFNITIFLLGAELAPLSHALKLLQARTLHLQRVVTGDPDRASRPAPTAEQWEEVSRRLAQLECRPAPADAPGAGAGANAPDPAARRARQEAALVREVRNAIQPELDALNRAVRRYEKKATVLAFQTESRLGAVDTRLDDAISLAAAAAKNSGGGHWGVAGWLADRAVRALLLPLEAAAALAALAFRTVSAVVFRRKAGADRSGGGGGRAARSGRAGQGHGSERDRVPSRLSRR